MNHVHAHIRFLPPTGVHASFGAAAETEGSPLAGLEA